MKTLRSLVMGACARALRRLAANAWPLLQSTHAVAARVLANWLGDHRDPFFAPMAAVVALNASRGERGSNAVRLLVGVVVGIVAGELAVGALGGGYGTLTVATFAAMVVAIALGGARVMTAQAATGAILTVAVADGQPGSIGWPTRWSAPGGAGVHPGPVLAAAGRAAAPRVRELAGAIGDLAGAPGDPPARQRAADRALDLARSAPGSRHGPSRPSPPPSPSGWSPPMSWCSPASIPVRPSTQCGRAAERSTSPTRRPGRECHSTPTVGAHLPDVGPAPYSGRVGEALL